MLFHAQPRFTPRRAVVSFEKPPVVVVIVVTNRISNRTPSTYTDEAFANLENSEDRRSKRTSR